MAQIKISELSTLSQQLTNADYIPIVHSGATYKYAPFNYLVKNSGNETIAGVKTFSSSPVVPTPAVTDNSTNVATTAWVHTTTAPVSDISRITDVSGDGLPDIPTDPSGLTYRWLKTSLDSWAIVGTGSIAYSSGVITATSSGSGDMGVSRAISSSSKLVRFKISSSKTGTIQIRATISSVDTLISTNSIISGTPQYVNAYISGAFTDIRVVLVSSVSGDTLKLYDAYVGTGAYLEPLHDKAGNVKWTNYGLLPIKGYRGKGLLALGGQYAIADSPVIGTTGTLLVRFSKSQIVSSSARMLCANGGYSTLKGFWLLFEQNANVLILRTFNGSGGVNIFSIPVADTSEHTIGMSFNNGQVKSYFDGSYIGTYSTGMVSGTSNMTLFRDAEDNFAKLSGAVAVIRADSRVWTDAEALSWHNDPRSVDRCLPNALSIDWSNVPTYADKATANAANYYGPFKTSAGIIGYAG